MIDKDACPRDYEKPDCSTCDQEDCQDGRYLERVNEYASTCDGCGELTMHEAMEMDEETQLGYCETCQKKMKETK